MKLFGAHKVCESPKLDVGVCDFAMSPNGVDFSRGTPFRVFPNADFVQVSPVFNEMGGEFVTVSGIVIIDEVFFLRLRFLLEERFVCKSCFAFEHFTCLAKLTACEVLSVFVHQWTCR